MEQKETSTMDDAWDETLRGPRQAKVTRPRKTIWKYQIPVLEEFEIELPGDAEIIRFDNEGGLLWLWAVVEPDAPMSSVKIKAFKTGAEIPTDLDLTYLGCAAIYIQAELMLYYFQDHS